MLSKTERRYLKGIEEFEDKNPFYAKVIRSRIRKKVEQALLDLTIVVEKDRYGRRPAKEWRNRQNQYVINKENPTEQELAVANFRRMLNRTWRGKRESSMIIPIWIIDLVHAYAKKEPFHVERLIETVKEARKESESEKRSSLLQQYREEWRGYGKDWLETYLSFHESLWWDAGFKGSQDCLAWLEKEGQTLIA